MTIEFTTTITGMEAYPIKDSVPLYVFRVYWNYLGKDEKYETAMQGSTDVPTSDPQSAIPYADLTEEQVEDVRKSILKLVFVKNNAGHFAWIYAASVITILATINTML